jgi:hypothetical protein
MLLMPLNSSSRKAKRERLRKGNLQIPPSRLTSEIGHEGNISSDLKLMRLLPHRNTTYAVQAPNVEMAEEDRNTRKFRRIPGVWG